MSHCTIINKIFLIFISLYRLIFNHIQLCIYNLVQLIFNTYKITVLKIHISLVIDRAFYCETFKIILCVYFRKNVYYGFAITNLSVGYINLYRVSFVRNGTKVKFKNKDEEKNCLTFRIIY